MLTAIAEAQGTLVFRTKTGEHRFAIELAETPEQQAMGLMFRRSMPADSGMLFPYKGDSEIYMWMKNTFIPLDMIFLSRDGRVIRIERNTEPFSERVIPSGGPAAAVLEVNAGTADRIGLAEGDRAENALFSRTDRK
jgi:uncharacterized membrane protein (UPF0127 family)